MVDGGVTIVRWRLHGLREGEGCMMLLSGRNVQDIFLVGEKKMLSKQGGRKRGML